MIPSFVWLPLHVCKMLYLERKQQPSWFQRTQSIVHTKKLRLSGVQGWLLSDKARLKVVTAGLSIVLTVKPGTLLGSFHTLTHLTFTAAHRVGVMFLLQQVACPRPCTSREKSCACSRAAWFSALVCSPCHTAWKSQHFWLLVLPFALYRVASGPSWDKCVHENLAQLFKADSFIVVLWYFYSGTMNIIKVLPDALKKQMRLKNRYDTDWVIYIFSGKIIKILINTYSIGNNHSEREAAIKWPIWPPQIGHQNISLVVFISGFICQYLPA